MRIIPTPCPDNDAALLDAFGQHLADRDLAPATVQAYLSDLARFQAWLAWAHDDQAPLLTQIRTVDLAAFRTHLIHEQAHPPATVNRRLQGLRLFFYWLAERNWIDQNPTARLRFMRKSSPSQPMALKRQEAFALIHAAAASPHGLAARNVALVQLMLQTGLRVGEVAALTHADITLKSRAGSVHVREGKGRKARDVPLNTTARRALQAYLDIESEPSPQAPIFRSKRGAVLAVRSVQAMVTRLAQQAKIERLPVSAQTLRHTFARHYLQQHPSKLRELADLLGHESLDTTAVYTRPLYRMRVKTGHSETSCRSFLTRFTISPTTDRLAFPFSVW